MPSPAARLFIGLRLYMDVARRFPLFANSSRGPARRRSVPTTWSTNTSRSTSPRGSKAGEFVDAPVPVALDMVVGAGLIAVARISPARADDAYLAAMLSALARSLGLDKSRTQTLLSAPLSSLELDPNSLLMQSHARFQKQKRRKRENAQKAKNKAAI